MLFVLVFFSHFSIAITSLREGRANLSAFQVSYCDHFSSVVRPCVRPLSFSNDFSSEAAEPILLKFHMEPP